jgi:quercetin dioxygenase-like cupin family protein
MSERGDDGPRATRFVSTAPPAPRRAVVRRAEARCAPSREVTGHAADGGEDCVLIGAHVNGAPDLTLGLYRMRPNEYHPRHFHGHGSEFYYVLDGSCLVTVDDEVVEATVGTAVYLPAGTVHAVRTREGESVTILYGFGEGIAEHIAVTWLE